MNANVRRNTSIWQAWKNGILRREYAHAIGAIAFAFSIPTIVFANIQLGLSGLAAFAIFAGLLQIFFTLPLSFTDIKTPSESRNLFAAELEPMIDRILNRIDNHWSESQIVRIGESISQQSVHATKDYRHSFGVTWDQAEAAIKDWPMTMLKAKFDAIEKTIAEREPQLVGNA